GGFRKTEEEMRMPSAHPTRAALSDNFLSILSVVSALCVLCVQSLDEYEKYVRSGWSIQQIDCAVNKKAFIRSPSRFHSLTWTRN
ncbi:MAG: hypothetical protein D3904_14810, partial [Candidatus Electrothrix sp. EH2]|nr:hypothetical protein [Candidatus Electrothrix sp. EH2]